MNRYDDDPVWDALFAGSQDMLAAMADKALAEARAGKTEPLDPDTLTSVSLPTAPAAEGWPV